MIASWEIVGLKDRIWEALEHFKWKSRERRADGTIDGRLAVDQLRFEYDDKRKRWTVTALLGGVEVAMMVHKVPFRPGDKMTFDIGGMEASITYQYTDGPRGFGPNP